MIEISTETAVRFFKQDVPKYLGELIALEHNMPPVPRKLFGDAEVPGAIMVVMEFPHGASAAISGCNEEFAAECFAWLAESYGKCSLGVFDESLLGLPMIRDRIGPIRRVRSFICTTLDQVPLPSVPVEMLDASDKEPFERYPQEPSSGRPPLSKLFQWLVLDRRGEIFAIRRGTEILGYLSAMKEYENIWDVDFIHVRREERRRGLGTQLAAGYARETLSHGEVPYYSGAANEASDRAAISAGFACCRELFWSEDIKVRV
jgi:GNAT superfamily N-acetyltransferase